jgi:hypothetical protein
MDHSDSESDFELHAVDPVHDSFSDDPSETSSEEHEGELKQILPFRLRVCSSK